jgi:peptidyl-prolyl cis-trans isomerase D
MLQNIRDNSKGVISYILIGFLVVIFALFGVESLFNWNPSENQAAEVNGEAITQNDLSNAIARQKQQMLSRYGDQIPSEFLSEDYLRKPVLENLIQNALLSQAAKSAGMAVGQDLISEQIASAPVFKDEAGVFDNARYKQTISSMGYTHSTYVNQLAKDMLLNQIHSGLVNSAFTTQQELDDLVALSYQSRDFSYFTIPAEKVKSGVSLSDEEINNYYAQNPQAYTSEEQVSVDYIDLNVTALMSEVKVTEEQLRKQYEQSLTSFVAAPERQAAHILIEGKNAEKIKTVTDKLAAGGDFAELAKTYSDDPASNEQGGDLGFTKGDIFPKEFEAALATLKVGEVSAPVVTEAGTHIIKLLSERGSQAPTFEEQKASLEEQLKRAEAENIFVAKLDQLKELSFNADNLAEVATDLGLKVENSGFFSRNSGTGIAANKQFADAAFSDEVLQEGNSSEPVEFDAGRVVVLKKTEYKPSRLQSLEEVKAQVVAVLTEEKTRQLIREKGSKLVADLRSGAALADLAKAEGQEPKVVKVAKRNSTDADPEVSGFVFDMAKPQAGSSSFDGFVTAKGDYVVIALDSVTLATSSNEIAPEQKQAMVAQINNVTGQTEFTSYQAYLKASADIE